MSMKGKRLRITKLGHKKIKRKFRVAQIGSS